MNQFVVRFERTIIAGGQLTLPAAGTLLVIKEATAPFDCEIDDGERNILEAGINIQIAEGFQRLHIFNRSATVALTVVLLIGKAGVGYNYNRAAPTRLVVTPFVTLQPTGLAPLNRRAIPGINSGARRKQILIGAYPDDVTHYLTVMDSADNIFAQIPSGKILPLDTDADLIVINNYPTGTIIVTLGEIYWQ